PAHMTIGRATSCSVCQPWVLTSTPDENADTACTANTVTSFTPCAFAFSTGRYASVSSVVPPMYMKFQPRPSITSASQKGARGRPERPTGMHPLLDPTPASITCSTPKRRMSEPVKNDGANIAITCEDITVAAES